MWQRPVGILIYLVGGEAIQSALHFGLNIALLNSIPVRDYGVFALVMVVGGIGITYIRALTALPPSTLIAKSQSESSANAFEVSFGIAALLLSTLLGGGVVFLTNYWLDQGALNGGAFVGFWGLRSHLRTVLLARKLRVAVSIGDLAFVASGAAGATLAMPGASNHLDLAFFAMGCANVIGIAAMLAFTRRPIRIHARRHALRRYRVLWPDLKWSLLSVTIINLQGQGMALLVATLAGPAAYAPIAAALVLFVPLRIVSTAFANMVQPELSALMRQGDIAAITRLMRLWPGPLALLCLLYGLAIAAAMPWIEPPALRNSNFHTITILAWAMSSLPLLYAVPKIWLEIGLDYRAIAIVSALAAAIGLSIVMLVLQTDATSWALAGGAASEFIVMCGLWFLAVRRQKVVSTA